MRVISGVRKGLRLKAPDGLDTRPTTDRVKESLFNILQQYMPAKRVLDLFAGSAALGIEALSRRCESCVFIENGRAAYNTASANITAAGFESKSKLLKTDAVSYLKGCTDSNADFDIVFMDPPYNKGMIYPILDLISHGRLLSPNGIVVTETEKDGENPEHPSFDILRQAVYGKTVITVLTLSTTDRR